MRRLVIALALAALLVSGCQTSPDTTAVDPGLTSSPTPSTTSPSASPTPSETPTPTRTPSPVVSPDLITKSTCSVATGKYPKMTKGVRFTAQGTVGNRGNIGASVQVKATWVGKAVVHRATTVSVGYGKNVTVTLNAPTTAAEVAAFRAKGKGRCQVVTKLLSFVGKPRPTKK